MNQAAERSEPSQAPGMLSVSARDSAVASVLKQVRAVRGFTLIEVIIVVAIIGILAAIAYPSYGQYVAKTRRSDGHLALLSAVQGLERCKATSFSYAGCALGTTDSPEKFYTLELEDLTPATYTVIATPGGKHNDPDCTTITLDQLGTKGFTGIGPCWN